MPRGCILSPLTAEDDAVLLELLEEHVSLTRSAWGKQLADRWPETRGRFVKVVSVEYQRLVDAARASADANAPSPLAARVEHG